MYRLSMHYLAVRSGLLRPSRQKRTELSIKEPTARGARRPLTPTAFTMPFLGWWNMRAVVVRHLRAKVLPVHPDFFTVAKA